MNNYSLNFYYIEAICVLIRIYSINVYLQLSTRLKQKTIQLMAENGTKM